MNFGNLPSPVLRGIIAIIAILVGSIVFLAAMFLVGIELLP
jgi:hypothetical protein